jgi:hypothetical protein
MATPVEEPPVVVAPPAAAAPPLGALDAVAPPDGFAADDCRGVDDPPHPASRATEATRGRRWRALTRPSCPEP